MGALGDVHTLLLQPVCQPAHLGCQPPQALDAVIPVECAASCDCGAGGKEGEGRRGGEGREGGK